MKIMILLSSLVLTSCSGHYMIRGRFAKGKLEFNQQKNKNKQKSIVTKASLVGVTSLMTMPDVWGHQRANMKGIKIKSYHTWSDILYSLFPPMRTRTFEFTGYKN